jgi:serine-type D-Ala-D-Ala endopeptidase (penicillin-binding protein 7)
MSCGIGVSSGAAATSSRRATQKQAGVSRATTVVKTPRLATRRYSARRAASRRATLARARAAVYARQLREASTPHYKLDSSGSLVPDIRAAAAIIYNPENGQVLWEENSQDSRSIASITKVMTAAVFLESNPDLMREVTVERVDTYAASTTYLKTNERIVTGDVLHLLLIASDNAAARVLARVSDYGSAGFVQRMNEKAVELGLTSTHYADPSGLDASNVSSAYDMARLIAYASSDERIASVMRTAEYTVHTNRRAITVRSTNQLVRSGDVDVRAGKTGFIGKSGYCLATLLRLPQGGAQVAVVVLGARSNAGRFMETRHLLNWFSSKAQEVFGKTPPPQPPQN